MHPSLLALFFSLSHAAPATPALDGPRADMLLLDLKGVAISDANVKIEDGLVAEAIGKALARWPAHPRLATSNDIRTLVTLEAEKAVAGCDDAGCMAELAGALGARYVITGTLGKLGNDVVLQLALFDVRGGSTLARASASASTNAIVGAQLDDLATRIVAPLAPAGSSSTSAASTPVASAGGPSALAITGGVVAGVGVVAAAGAGAFALVLDQRLAAGSGATFDDKKQALDIGPGVVAASAIGGAVAVVGAAMLGLGAALGDS